MLLIATHELKIKKAELIKSVPLLHKKEVVDLNIRQFCENAKIHLERSVDFASKRKFLLEHVEKIIYEKYKVSILGSIPIKLKTYEDAEQTSEASKIEFRIESQIDTSTLHRGLRLKFAEDGRLKAYGSSGRFKIISNSPLKRVRLPVGPMGPREKRNTLPISLKHS